MNQPQDSQPKSSVEVLREKDDAWLKTLYIEAWKQYVHEDVLTQARTNIFQVVPVVLLALLGAASTALIKIGCATFQNTPFLLGVSLVGVVWILVAFLMLSLTKSFEKVTAAGQAYVNLRHMNVRALERLAGTGPFGPALMEHQMRDFRPLSDGNDRFFPFKGIRELSPYADLSLDTYSGFGGFTYLRHLILVWRIVFRVVLALGFVILALGIFAPALELQKVVPTLSC